MLSRRSFIKRTLAGVTGAYFITGTSFAEPRPKFISRKDIRFRFAVASDGHYGQPDTPFEQDFSNLVQWLNNEKQTKGLDLCVFNGDLIHDQPDFLPAVKTHFDKLTTPYYTTRGNHDRVDGNLWQNTWGYGLNHEVLLKNNVFILADTSNEKGEYLCADLTWMEDRLKQHKNKQNVFIFMHITPNKWTTNGVDCPDLMKRIESFPNVKAIFHGHDHDVDTIKQSGNKPYIFDGHFGGSWGVNYKGYRIVEIDKKGNIFTYQFNPGASPVVNSGWLES
jgi:DNA repair exonuclease SbcCD nuclease subunit